MISALIEYGLFFAKTATLLIALVIALTLIFSLSRRDKTAERLIIKNINQKYDTMRQLMEYEVLDKKLLKKTNKEHKKENKIKKKEGADKTKQRLFVLNFKGDIRATAVASLREEVTALLTVANKEDEVLLCLENSGGTVHEHGLAASQLLRIRQREIPLVIAVDKVAASGGYLMACTANKIIAAPFAIIGSIGVLAQIPNFHRILEKHGVDFEQITAGKYKRTITMFGKNTDEDREKLKQDLEEIHDLFKSSITQYRAELDIEQVATGEHWYGQQALELKLVDELMTSDDYLLEKSKVADLFEITYQQKKKLGKKLGAAAKGMWEEFSNDMSTRWKH
ncbi:MAG: protease SohB [Gammaproteobacteria bacterium]|nr:protease SohB [Gammaproteobacteria bacterium]